MDISMDIHSKICGYGYGYGWDISYPRQAWKTSSRSDYEHVFICFTDSIQQLKHKHYNVGYVDHVRPMQQTNNTISANSFYLQIYDFQ